MPSAIAKSFNTQFRLLIHNTENGESLKWNDMYSSKFRHTNVNVAEILHWDLTAAHNKALTPIVKQ